MRARVDSRHLSAIPTNQRPRYKGSWIVLPDNHWHTQLSPDETMIWFFARDGEELRVETRYDSDAAEYLLVVCWPDGDQHERFVDVSEFRSRLVTNGAEARLFQIMLTHFEERGLLKARGKQRSDSTHILAAIRQLNQLELVHETLRHTLKELALQSPAWLKRRGNVDWFDCYSQRTSNYLLPKKETERQKWAERIGRDGLFLLEQIYHAGHHPELVEIPAVDILRRVWLQNFYQNDEQVRLREPKDQPPSAQRITSPYDLEARCSTKRDTTWTGYKVHLNLDC